MTRLLCFLITRHKIQDILYLTNIKRSLIVTDGGISIEPAVYVRTCLCGKEKNAT